MRWTTLAAGAGALVAGYSGFGASMPLTPAALLLGLFALSNVWLMWRVRGRRTTGLNAAAGALVCADVLLLSWLLLESGSELNPVSVFLLVQIVLAALVLGRLWTWVVTLLSVAGYATLFLVPSSELSTAQSMHPEIGLHMRGMWLAFTVTALTIGALVTRLALAIEHRDRALETLRERNARAMRFASLTTLAAGAAHELSTPLATIAVASRELEQALGARGTDADLRDDAQLIRKEIDRCRRLLDDMAGRIAEPTGEAPRPAALTAALGEAIARLAPGDRTSCRAQRGDRLVSRLARWRDCARGRQPGQQRPARVGGRRSRRRDCECRARRPRADRRRRSRARDVARGSRAGRRAVLHDQSLRAWARGSGCSSRAPRSSNLAARSRWFRRFGQGTTATILLDADVVRGDHGGA